MIPFNFLFYTSQICCLLFFLDFGLKAKDISATDRPGAAPVLQHAQASILTPLLTHWLG